MRVNKLFIHSSSFCRACSFSYFTSFWISLWVACFICFPCVFCFSRYFFRKGLLLSSCLIVFLLWIFVDKTRIQKRVHALEDWGQDLRDKQAIATFCKLLSHSSLASYFCRLLPSPKERVYIDLLLWVSCDFCPQTRSYHPGEMAPLRTPYDFDDEANATSTSTTEPSSSGFRSSMTSRYTTEDGTSTFGDDTSMPGMIDMEFLISMLC